jgi:chemotaxis protein MotB
MGKKSCPECKAGAPEWMVTYGDMMTLLLCFFVLLFSMSSMEKAKFDYVTSALSRGLGLFQGGRPINSGLAKHKVKEKNKLRYVTVEEELKSQFPEIYKELSPEEIKELFEKIKKELENNKKLNQLEKMENIEDEEEFLKQKYIEDKENEKGIKISRVEKGVKITLGSDALFDSGSANISQKSKDTLLKIIEPLKNSEKNIVIEGHTDSKRPVGKTLNRYKNNLNLSIERAKNVLDFLFKNGLKEKESNFQVIGYGSSKPAISDENLTEIEKDKKNRRVEILILDQEEIESDLINNLE